VGGKTGLTAVTAGVFFLLAALFTPLVNVIPPVVTAGAMVLLGIAMMGAAKDIDFGEWVEAIPAFVTLMVIIFTSSIIDGIALGMFAHIAVTVVSFKFKSLKVMELIVCALFFLAYCKL
jgi:AGZA family xanthine/uracil permease-like MFS transporter